MAGARKAAMLYPVPLGSDLTRGPRIVEGATVDMCKRLFEDHPDWDEVPLVEPNGTFAGFVSKLEVSRLTANGHAELPVTASADAKGAVIADGAPAGRWREILSRGVFPIAILAADLKIVAVLTRRNAFPYLVEQLDLRQQEQEIVADSTASGIVITDVNGVIRAWNRSAERLLGVPAAEALGCRLVDVLPELIEPPEPDPGMPPAPRRVRNCEVIIDRRPMTLDGRPAGAVIAIHDVAEPEGLMRELGLTRSTLHVLERVFDQACEGMVVVDHKGILRYLNQPLAELLGVTPTQVIGRHVRELLPDTRLLLVLETQQCQRGETLRIAGRDVIVNRIPIRDGENVVGVVGTVVFRDVSELRTLAKKLQLLETRVAYYERELKGRWVPTYTFANLVGESPEYLKAKRLAEKAALNTSTIVILGESGTGKELFAHAIHHASCRQAGPFVRVNSAAIPRELLEAELFGYEVGAFTGATRSGRPGKFELADGGTIFLDEIGDMPLEMQSKILRVLQEHEVVRIGGARPIKVDFRLIVATNQDLDKMTLAGSFRRDLYYRLNVIRLELPPLRDRQRDIPPLLAHYAEKLAVAQGIRPVRFTAEAIEALCEYPWPGNVRELTNLIERLVAEVPGTVVDVTELPAFIGARGPVRKNRPVASALRARKAEIEKETIIEALRAAGGNKELAAKRLGIHRSGLYQKLKRYGIARGASSHLVEVERRDQ